MWPFTKKKHKDEVRAFEYNGILYPSLHAMNAKKERDAKRDATDHIKKVLYYLCVNEHTYNRLDEFDKQMIECEAERHYIFSGEHDLQKLAGLLVEYWPYIQSQMGNYYTAKSNREANERGEAREVL